MVNSIPNSIRNLSKCVPILSIQPNKGSPMGWPERKLTSHLGKTTALHNASSGPTACTTGAVATYSFGQPVHSRLPPNAGLASDLKDLLLLRSSFSTSVHLLLAPPGTEHSLETCSYGSKITEER